MAFPKKSPFKSNKKKSAPATEAAPAEKKNPLIPSFAPVAKFSNEAMPLPKPSKKGKLPV